MIPYYTGLVSTSSNNVINMTNPKHRKALRIEDEDDIRFWAQSGALKDGYTIQCIADRYYLGMFSDRDYFAYVMQWE